MSVELRKTAAWVPVTQEVLDDGDGIGAFVERRVSSSIRDVAFQQLVGTSRWTKSYLITMWRPWRRPWRRKG